MSVRATVHRVTLNQFLAALWRTKLVYRRRQLGWTQRTLAEIAGYSRQSVAFWEQGRKTPTRASLKDWRDALGL
jgi:Predicted transcriptional regulators